MRTEKVDLRKELERHKFEFGLKQQILCSKEESKVYHNLLKNGEPLPEGVRRVVYESGELSTTEFFTVYEADLSDAEIQEYLTYKQLSMIKTIKKCAMFFTTLTIISIIVGFILVMSI